MTIVSIDTPCSKRDIEFMMQFFPILTPLLIMHPCIIIEPSPIEEFLET